MMNDFLLSGDSEKEEKERRIGILMSILVHLLLLLVCLLPFFQYQYPPEEKGGILVAFGNTTEETAQDANPEEEEVQLADRTEAAPPEQSQPEETQPEETTDSPSEPTPPTSATEVTTDITQEESPVQVDEEKAREKREAELKAERERAEARKRAEVERARAEEAERQKKAYEASKAGFNDLFSKGSSSDAEAGEQGNPDGDPSSENVDRLLSGDGTIGGSLGSREVTYIPNVTDDSQQEGKVVIRVCVNADGSVSEASFTQAGSTTNNPTLINKAISGARQYKFNAADIDVQYGTITFDFKLR